MKNRLLGLVSCALLVATPARSDLRPLNVPLVSGWQHADTGLILMPKLAGMERRSLAANGLNEFDIVAQYALPDGSTEATIYLFHAGIASVPLWFDRSRAAIEHRDTFGLSAGAAIPATSFAPPGSDVARCACPMRSAKRPIVAQRSRFCPSDAGSLHCD